MTYNVLSGTLSLYTALTANLLRTAVIDYCLR